MNFQEVDKEILDAYCLEKRLGKGAYGIVWKGKDKANNCSVAVKKIFDAFRNDTDAQRTFREVCFLKEFKEHENIIRLLNIKSARNDRDLYLIFEFMDADLHTVIRKHSILKDVHKRFIMYQILKGLKYIHSANVIHRDLKPSNILINEECCIKLCDFGLSRSLHSIAPDSIDPCLTDYVATRWYRAPEILLASSKYSKAVDIWSVGCIMGELLKEKPLFPGSSTLNQIEMIMSVIPNPTRTELNKMTSPYTRTLLKPCSSKEKYGVRFLLSPEESADAINLINQLLQFNPDKRPAADEAIKHPYILSFHNPNTEPVLDYDVIPPLNDDIKLSLNAYRVILYEDIEKNNLKCRRPHKIKGLNNKNNSNETNKNLKSPTSEKNDDEDDNHFAIKDSVTTLILETKYNKSNNFEKTDDKSLQIKPANMKKAQSGNSVTVATVNANSEASVKSKIKSPSSFNFFRPRSGTIGNVTISPTKKEDDNIQSKLNNYNVSLSPTNTNKSSEKHIPWFSSKNFFFKKTVVSKDLSNLNNRSNGQLGDLSEPSHGRQRSSSMIVNAFLRNALNTNK